MPRGLRAVASTPAAMPGLRVRPVRPGRTRCCPA